MVKMVRLQDFTANFCSLNRKNTATISLKLPGVCGDWNQFLRSISILTIVNTNDSDKSFEKIKFVNRTVYGAAAAEPRDFRFSTLR